MWVLTRAFVVSQVGFWDDSAGPEYEDVNIFQFWSDFIAANHAMPVEQTWQYPPGAGFLMLLPRIGGGNFGMEFIGLMLIFDLIALACLVLLASRERREVGVWVWLLAVPLLSTFSVLRFDMVPTAIAIAALVLIHRRPTWFGALAGIGATIKVWPIFVLFGEWDRKRLLRSVGAAAAVIVAVFAISAIAFGDQTGFLTNQKDRGLQIEAVAASPWQLRQLVTGTPVPAAERFGTQEITSGLADFVAKLLDVAAFLVLFAAAWWWWLRDRAIRQGRTELADPVLARDFVFAVVLFFVVVSRVLSPQFMIWLVGLSAVVLTAGRTRLARPAWVVIGAVVLTAGLYQSPANFVIRNLALLYAALDAAVVLSLLVLGREAGRSPDDEEEAPRLSAAGPAATELR
ncbi:MAG TPA: glycosyltransferase family 87 protein [Solirubrobacterales bacterium]|nr:glycosyltransferase family 87 protein [Solirubrobacterales bacterium]